jgi:hypothetical protein
MDCLWATTDVDWHVPGTSVTSHSTLPHLKYHGAYQPRPEMGSQHDYPIDIQSHPIPVIDEDSKKLE